MIGFSFAPHCFLKINKLLCEFINSLLAESGG